MKYPTRKKSGLTKAAQQPGSQSQKPSEITLVLLLALAVCVIVFAVQFPALGAKALLFDDNQYLIDNYLVQYPSWTSAKRFFTEVLKPSTVSGYYQPLPMVSLMLDCALGGSPQNLFPFHLTSLILHLCNTALVIVILYLLFGRSWVAVFAGLLFGLHPMTVENISWISERKTVLAAFFCLLAIVSYIQYTRSHSIALRILTIIFYIFALGSKPTSTPLPLLLLLFDFWPLHRLDIHTITEKIPLFLLAAISATITVISQANTAVVTMPQSKSLYSVFLIFCHNIVFYLYKIIWPVDLSPHYQFPSPFSLANPAVLVGLVGTFFILALVIFSIRYSRAPLTAFLFFVLALLPAMGIVGFTNAIASDRYVYFPSLGLLLILTSFIIYLLTKFSILRTAFAAIGLMLVGSEVYAARINLSNWRDSQTLTRHMLKVAPNAAILHNGLALLFVHQKKIDDALAEYQESLKLDPNDPETLNNFALALDHKGNLDEAVFYYKKAISIRPNNAGFYSNLGISLAKQGKLDQAVEQFQKALAINPDYPVALSNLAAALNRKGLPDKAIETYQHIIKLYPNRVNAYNNIASILIAQNKFNDAVLYCDRALAIDPKFVRAHHNVALALAKKGRINEAIEHYNKALEIDPNFLYAHVDFAVLLTQQRNFDQAFAHFKEALRLNSTAPSIYYSFGIALAESGRLDDAVAQFQKVLLLDPRHADAHCVLGYIYSKQGLTSQAISEYKASLSIDPNNTSAKAALQKLRPEQR